MPTKMTTKAAEKDCECVLLSQNEVERICSLCQRQWAGEFFDSISDCNNSSIFGIEIIFDPNGETSYHNSEENQIMIGLRMIVEQFKVCDPGLLISGVRYIRLHETGHLRYTGADVYSWAVNRGTEIIIEEIARREKISMRFRKRADYEYALMELFPKCGIFLNFREIQEAVRHIMNALEDGRIERCLSNSYKNFDSLRRVFRFITWDNSPIMQKQSCLSNPRQRMILLLNELLSLATTQLHMKGFEEEFSGTKAAEDVKSLMPYIYKGVTAATTRKMVNDAGLPLCKLMAPVIYEACKMNKLPGELKKLLEELIKTAIETGVIGVNEEEAEEDTSLFHPPFDMSDIEVTLDDDTYDRIMGNRREGDGSSGNGMRFKREHPKMDDSSESGNKEDVDEPAASLDSLSDKSDLESMRSEGEISPMKDHGEDGKIGSLDEGSRETITHNEIGQSKSFSKDQAGRDNEESQTSDDSMPDAINESCTEQTKQSISKPNEESANHRPGEKAKESVEALNQAAKDMDLESRLDKEMREAVNALINEAERSLDDITASLRTSAFKAPDKPVNTVPLSQNAVKQICPVDFEEVTRRYPLSDRLPVDLESRGRMYHRKYREFIENKKKPVSRYRKEGKIDSRNIFRLAMNKTDVFMREGKTDEFDGCAYILLDNSGSMRGRKKKAACRALAVQEMAFYGLFPFKIVAFDIYEAITHEIIKDWNELQPNSCSWNYALKSRNGGGNADEHDIRIATMELLKRPERRKLLMVLSDGAPDDIEDTKKAVKEARDKGITVVGIYFEEGDVSSNSYFPYMYANSPDGGGDYVMCSLPEIEPQLSKILERFFKS